jgi:large subunit ribosomal protein L9
VEVILLEKIRNLGVLGDKVKVKSGFARNFLIPQGKAVFANAANVTKFEAHRAELEKEAAAKFKLAQEKQQALNALPVVTITAKAGEEGKLFGSIGTRDIAEAITKAGVEVEKREVSLPEGALRMIGNYEIAIELDGDLESIVKLSVVGEA